MEKLELEHLAGYLPCRLNIEFERCIYPRRKEKEVLNPKHLELSFYGIKNNFKIKPILHPLSDLIKVIEVNGEKIVPMLELAKIAFPKNRPFDDFHIKNNYVKLDKRNHQGYSFHFDKKEVSFDCRFDYNEKTWRTNCYVPNQLKLIEKLYEWHFDIHGLIEKGLAIDINTLK